MIVLLMELFFYGYMINVMWVFVLVGGVCVFLFVFLMLKGWFLIGDVFVYFVVLGVVGVYIFGLLFVFGVFFVGGLVVGVMLFLFEWLGLKVDVIIGLIFMLFFGFGFFIVLVNLILVLV